ncbi:hypothetical protein L3V83_04515 [Thiotrichales bacterium 19X7-9]|nr:hypothetical protein [Thiotrichales bacterium 19X7-9]
MIDIQRNEQTITWQINDSLCFGSVMPIEQKALTLYGELNKNIRTWVIDINMTKAIDSAGLSWLLLQKSLAMKHNLTLKITGLSTNPKASELAKVQGVYNLLV